MVANPVLKKYKRYHSVTTLFLNHAHTQLLYIAFRFHTLFSKPPLSNCMIPFHVAFLYIHFFFFHFSLAIYACKRAQRYIHQYYIQKRITVCVQRSGLYIGSFRLTNPHTLLTISSPVNLLTHITLQLQQKWLYAAV